MPVEWISRPVFLTSTFRDMHAERDYLRTHIFPQLEERLRQRRHHLEPIDLRWGVETVTVDQQQSKELLVLQGTFSDEHADFGRIIKLSLLKDDPHNIEDGVMWLGGYIKRCYPELFEKKD